MPSTVTGGTRWQRCYGKHALRLIDAKEVNVAKLKGIENEQDTKKKDALRRKFLDKDHEIGLKNVELHPCCHEQQVERLILFDQRMRWPWINDVRDYAEEAYTNLRGSQITQVGPHGWLYGPALPGKWFIFKIMTALVMCAPVYYE